MSSRGQVARLVRGLVTRGPHGIPSCPQSECLARPAMQALGTPSVGPSVIGGAQREGGEMLGLGEPHCDLPGASAQDAAPGRAMAGVPSSTAPWHSAALAHRPHSASPWRASQAGAGLGQPGWHCASLSGSSLAAPGVGLFSRGLRTAPRRLRVVLRKYVPGLGRPGDVVSVSPGYARNFLIPTKLAFPALDKYIVAVQAAREQGEFGSEEELEALGSDGTPKAQAGARGESGGGGDVAVEVSHEDRVREAEDVAERLDAGKVSLRRITPRRSDQLRQAVSSDDIIAEVQRQLGVSLVPKNVVLPAPLQKIGVYDIPLVFPKDVTLPGGKEQITLKVNVRRK